MPKQNNPVVDFILLLDQRHSRQILRAWVFYSITQNFTVSEFDLVKSQILPLLLMADVCIFNRIIDNSANLTIERFFFKACIKIDSWIAQI